MTSEVAKPEPSSPPRGLNSSASGKKKEKKSLARKLSSKVQKSFDRMKSSINASNDNLRASVDNLSANLNRQLSRDIAAPAASILRVTTESKSGSSPQKAKPPRPAPAVVASPERPKPVVIEKPATPPPAPVPEPEPVVVEANDAVVIAEPVFEVPEIEPKPARKRGLLRSVVGILSVGVAIATGVAVGVMAQKGGAEDEELLGDDDFYGKNAPMTRDEALRRACNKKWNEEEQREIAKKRACINCGKKGCSPSKCEEPLPSLRRFNVKQ